MQQSNSINRFIWVAREDTSSGARRSMLLRRMGFISGLAIAAAFPSHAFAQNDASAQSADGGVGNPDRETDRNEIIVTAQKRDQNVADVPISVVVLGGEELDRSTASGISETLNRVPSVSTTASFGVINSGTQIAIRGVNAAEPLFAGASPIAYYVDSSPFGLARSAIGPDANAYDLERVEVLRGPQGTLYGASALNGVVRILTHEPDLNDFEFKARGLVSGTKGGDANFRGDAALNVPIIEDGLAIRAVGGYQDDSGWVDRPNKENDNYTRIANGRVRLTAQPTADLKVGLSAWISRGDFGGPNASDDNQARSGTLGDVNSVDFNSYSATIDYDLPWVNIFSTTSYFEYEAIGQLDLSALALPPLFTTLDANTFSQEIVLNSNTQGSWDWTLGGMYRDSDDRTLQEWGLFVDPYDVSNRSESIAVYGQITKRLLGDQLELTGGLRYFHDTVTQYENSNTTGSAPAGQISKSSFEAVTPRVAVTWHANDDTIIYASYSEGFRSGFDQNPEIIAVAPSFGSAKPDKLRNYELGFKSEVVNRVFYLEGALFFIDWQDIQQQIRVEVVPNVPFIAILNGESASGVGFELSATLQPVEGLRLSASAGWNDLRMDEDVTSGGVLFYSKGDRLSLSPSTTLSAAADYEFPLGGDLTGTLSGSVNYTSRQDFRTLTGNTLLLGVGDTILTSRASFAVNSASGWTATVFVDNLNNETGATTRNPLLPEFSQRLRPRTIGAQVQFHF